MQDSHDKHRAFLGTAFKVCKERDPRERGLFKRCKNGYRLLLSVRLKDGQNYRRARHLTPVTKITIGGVRGNAVEPTTCDYCLLKVAPVP